MPWRGPAHEGEYPSLGHQVAQLIEERCVIPDGDHMGEPFVLTDEMLAWLIRFYRIEPDAKAPKGGRLRYRRGQLVRPQKWGKGPFSAAVVCAEIDPDGPVRFDGWDARGEPVGRSWPTPHVQITAVSGDQTDNVWRALQPMIELGPLAAEIPDTGATRINLPGGGLIEPVTSATLSRIGQRITFAVQDQTESWLKRNGMRGVADSQLRGLAGMGGRAMETPNGWDPNEESVAQQTHRAAQKLPDVFSDFPPSPKGSFRNARERRKVLAAVYGDSWWVPLDRIDADCVELIDRGDMAQAERWFGNRIVSGQGVAFDVELWKALAVERVVPKGELIVIGFDGARVDDSTAMIATDVETGHQWPLGIWERPEGDDDWEVDESSVTAALEAAFDRYEVWRVYADPPYWSDTINAWAGKHGDKVIVRWWTNRVKAMCWAVRGYVEAMGNGALSHDGDPVLARHVANARRRQHQGIRDDRDRPMYDITKDRPGSPDKIDGAMAGILSWEARGDAVAAGAKKTKKRASTPGRIR
jgi:hypothetical protein